jgi:hypothetical protein
MKTLKQFLVAMAVMVIVLMQVYVPSTIVLAQDLIPLPSGSYSNLPTVAGETAGHRQ